MFPKKNPGFAGAQASIAKTQNIPMANAGAILGAGAQKASPAAKAANPNLKKVAAPKKHNAHTRKSIVLGGGSY